MTDGPPLWGRMFARFQGEVPTTTLEAYRRASLPVFELLDEAESRRLAGAADGLSPWTLPPATRTASLCAWNAFVLQALGNDILDADYEQYPATAGFVPPVTADQVLVWFTEVETWLDRARQAYANAGYRLDVDVPAALPSWRDTHPCPPAHLRGMLRALHTVAEHAGAFLAALDAATPPALREQGQLNHLRQLYASAQSKARYAAELHGADATPDVRVRVERHARDAIERFFTLGQLIADPTRVPASGPPRPALPPPSAPPAADSRPGPARTERRAADAKSASAHGKRPPGNRPGHRAGRTPPPEPRLPLPGDPRFDPWCLTDESVRDALASNQQAAAALRGLWGRDPDPARTLALQADIQAALARGDLELATVEGGGRLGYWHQPPWGSVYEVKRRVELNDQLLLPGERFVLGLTTGRNGTDFRRRLLLGDFNAEGTVAYSER